MKIYNKIRPWTFATNIVWNLNEEVNLDVLTCLQIRVKPQDESRSYPALSATYWLFKRKDYSTWRRVKNTDEIYFWHRGTTLLVGENFHTSLIPAHQMWPKFTSAPIPQTLFNTKILRKNTWVSEYFCRISFLITFLLDPILEMCLMGKSLLEVLFGALN